MATTLLTRDASDLDGSDTTISADIEITQDEAVTLLYVNDLDVSLTADAQLSHFDDEDLADAYTANSQSVAAGERGVDTLHEDVWERAGVTLSFGSAPSSGSVKVMLIRQRRDN